MYAALQRLGFPARPHSGAGLRAGAFHRPDAGRACTRRSHITGIEIDSITARLARHLYPDADIRHQPFEEARLADGFYDVAISNIPFGDYKPFDPRFKNWNFVIHDYFFAQGVGQSAPRRTGLVHHVQGHDGQA